MSEIGLFRRHLDDIKKYVPEFVPEFIPEFFPEFFFPEFDLNTDFYSGTNSGMYSGTNFFMSSKLRLRVQSSGHSSLTPSCFGACLDAVATAHWCALAPLNTWLN